jgi:hypothetical protein
MRLAAGAVMALAAVIADRAPAQSEARQSVAQMARPNVADVQVTIEFDQTAPPADSVTVVFANAAADVRKIPPSSAPFGEAVVQPFSFPLRRNSKTASHASYSTRTRDRRFLDARYIRVVHKGSTPWMATTISLTVAGQRVLNRVAMYPRKSKDAFTNQATGLGGWNPSAWKPVYWETELFRYTHPAKIY